MTAPLIPAKGSFRAVLLENSTTRLYIHPLEWTASHLQYLSCHLHITDKDSPLLIEYDLPSGLTWEMVQRKLARVRGKNKHGRDQNLREIVRGLGNSLHEGLQLSRDQVLNLQFSNRPVASIFVPLIAWHATPGKPATLMWAYLDEAWSSKLRHQYYEKRKKCYSFATNAIKKFRDMVIDPLYIAVIIALAQKQAREGAKDQKICLFVPEHIQCSKPQTRSTAPPLTNLVQYIGAVKYEYLQKFHNPYAFYDSTLDISKTIIPIQSPQRVVQAIREASRLTSPSKPANAKRKALTDIPMNGYTVTRSSKRQKHGSLNTKVNE